MEQTGESVSKLFRKFHMCESYVRQGKIAACIILFLEVMEKMPQAPLLNKERKLLMDGIFALQRNLAAHKNFKEFFGPVTFDDTDLKTTYEFLKQLQLAHEEELRERMVQETASNEAERLDVDTLEELDDESTRERATLAIEHIDKGDMNKAIEIIDGMDGVISYIIHHYNTLGIQSREAASYPEAIANYQKALAVYDQDEGLYYNMARSYYELGEYDKSRESLGRALAINPQFNDARILNNHLKTSPPPKRGSAKKRRGLITLVKQLLARKKSHPMDEISDTTPDQ
jgi:tetratricopeptide (TPR) repeat protein